MSEAAVGGRLAIEGGTPVRSSLLSYGGQWVTNDDIAAVTEALHFPWLTGGARVDEFERALAGYVGAAHAVAVSSGTAALHTAVYGAGIGPGDEVITTPMTFVASANSVLFQGGLPVFVDVDPITLNLDPEAAVSAVTRRTRALLAVHYAGHPCHLDALRDLARRHRIALIEAAAHALGARYHGVPVGADSDFAVFSFHPVKLVTTGEGGAIVCREGDAAKRMRAFRSHGIRSTGREREARGEWQYDMEVLGYNYRLTDFQCMLGIRQLSRAQTFVARRRELAARYQRDLSDCAGLELPVERPDCESAWHLYPVRLRLERLRADRDRIFAALRAEGIGVTVHYKPVHLHSYYQERFGLQKGQFPVAEAAYHRLLTLPLFPRMTDRDADDVIAGVRKVIEHYLH